MEQNSYQYFPNGLPRPAQASESESSDESGSVTPFHNRHSQPDLASQGAVGGIPEDYAAHGFGAESRADHRERLSQQSVAHIWRLFGDHAPTLQGHSDSGSGTSGDWNYDRRTGGQRNDSEWDEIDETQGQRGTPRTVWGRCFVDAKAEVRRLFLYAITVSWADSPGLDADAAWMSLVAWCQREAVFESDSDVARAWAFAFDQPAHAHFRTLYNSSLATIRSLW